MVASQPVRAAFGKKLVVKKANGKNRMKLELTAAGLPGFSAMAEGKTGTMRAGITPKGSRATWRSARMATDVTSGPKPARRARTGASGWPVVGGAVVAVMPAPLRGGGRR